ncbi:MAG: GNAT family N-acetyltransferase [Planctomycetaceae bacterium]
MPSSLIRPMTRDDLSDAVSLSQSTGWNQLAADWQRLLHYQPDGCFVATQDERVVGTVTTTSYPGARHGSVAWIGMMLVHDSVRRQGIASRLMNTALDFLHQTGAERICLDATPAGLPVYSKLGFTSQFVFHRRARTGNSQVIPVHPSPAGILCSSLDQTAFAANRHEWLTAVADDSRVISESNGFGMLRSGAIANYLGPVTAINATIAADIIDRLLIDQHGPVFWDIPSVNPIAETLAEERGFQCVRELTRMWTGLGPPLSDYSMQFALCDPGTG